jgi:hypothetical protein
MSIIDFFKKRAANTKERDSKYSYFIEKTEKYAEMLGRHTDHEFPSKFDDFLNQLPRDNRIKKDALLALKQHTIDKYQKHRSKMTVPCTDTCQFTKGVQRNIPFIDAELKKIHKVNLFFDRVAEFVKNFPSFIFSKFWTIIKLVTGG